MFGVRYMSTLYGFVFLSHQVGSFIAVWLGGLLYDRFGSYNLVWWLSEKHWVRVVTPALGFAWAIAMGLSRVYLGHHWLTDVFFGWFFGLAWLALLITVHRILLRLDRRDRRIAESGGVPDQPPEKAIEPDGATTASEVNDPPAGHARH